jgi:hypothetical protein
MTAPFFNHDVVHNLDRIADNLAYLRELEGIHSELRQIRQHLATIAEYSAGPFPVEVTNEIEVKSFSYMVQPTPPPTTQPG